MAVPLHYLTCSMFRLPASELIPVNNINLKSIIYGIVLMAIIFFSGRLRDKNAAFLNSYNNHCQEPLLSENSDKRKRYMNREFSSDYYHITILKLLILKRFRQGRNSLGNVVMQLHPCQTSTMELFGKNSWRFQLRDHSFSTYAKFPEKLIFLTLWHAHVRLRIRG